MHQALGAANCSTCKLTTLQRKVGRRLSSGCEPPSFSYGTGQSLGFLFTSSVVGRRVLVLSSGWLASYVGQSEVPALITSLFFLLSSFSDHCQLLAICILTTQYNKMLFSWSAGEAAETSQVVCLYRSGILHYCREVFLLPCFAFME